MFYDAGRGEMLVQNRRDGLSTGKPSELDRIERSKLVRITSPHTRCLAVELCAGLIVTASGPDYLYVSTLGGKRLSITGADRSGTFVGSRHPRGDCKR